MVLEQREKGKRSLLRRRRVLPPSAAGVLRGKKPVHRRSHFFWHVGGQDHERPARGIVGGDVPFVGPKGAVVAIAVVSEQARAIGIVTGAAKSQQRHRGVVALRKSG